MIGGGVDWLGTGSLDFVVERCFGEMDWVLIVGCSL
jgi:hypothetical protein